MMVLITWNVEMGREVFENKVERLEHASFCKLLKSFSCMCVMRLWTCVGEGDVEGKAVISVDFVCLCVSSFLVCYWLVSTDSVACGLACGEV